MNNFPFPRIRLARLRAQRSSTAVPHPHRRSSLSPLVSLSLYLYIFSTFDCSSLSRHTSPQQRPHPHAPIAHTPRRHKVSFTRVNRHLNFFFSSILDRRLSRRLKPISRTLAHDRTSFTANSDLALAPRKRPTALFFLSTPSTRDPSFLHPSDRPPCPPTSTTVSKVSLHELRRDRLGDESGADG